MSRVPRRLGAAIAVFTAVTAFVAVGAAPAFAISGGAAVTDGSKGFVAKLQIGDITSCAGVLVAPQWVLSSASCFQTATTPTPGGPPPVRTTVTLGRNNLSGTGGHTALAVKLVPRSDRDVVLVQLDNPITDVTPIGLALAAPAVGDTLRSATFGRTATEWVPDQLQSAQFQVTSSAGGTTVDLAGSSDAVSLCMGDAGGPLFSESASTPKLVAINTLARSNGCLGSSETATGATATLVTDLASWINSVTAVSPDGYYVPITSTRILDTRFGTGTSGNTTTPVPANTTLTLQITGKNGVPAKDVTAVALTVDSIGQSGNGVVTVYPDQVARPSTSNLNYAAGPAVANFVVVPVGANGAIDLFNAGSSTHLFADLAGYFTDDYTTAGASTYAPIIPKRFLDTRDGTGTTGGRLGNNGAVTVSIEGVNSIPTANVTAVAVNLTAVNPSGPGFLVPYAHNTTQPAVSGVQYQASINRSISAIVPLGADGKFVIYTTTSTDVIADVAGYFTTDGIGMKFHPATPSRLEDTRTTGVPIPAGGTAAKPPFAQGTPIIAGAQAAAAPAVTPPITQLPFISSVPLINVTVVSPASFGYIENYPYGGFAQTTSAIQFNAGQVVPNLIFAPLANTRSRPAPFPETIFFNASAASTDVVYDYYGSFTYDDPGSSVRFSTDGSILEDGSYPNAAAIEAAQNIHLISGDGHIVFADCATAPVNGIGVMRVDTTDMVGADGLGEVCFKVTGPTGVLNLTLPAVYSIRGDGYPAFSGNGHNGTAEVIPDGGAATTVTLKPDQNVQVGIAADPPGPPTTLLQLTVGP